MVLFYGIEWYIDFRDLVYPPPLAIVAVDAPIAPNAPVVVPANDVILDVAYEAPIPAA